MTARRRRAAAWAGLAVAFVCCAEARVRDPDVAELTWTIARALAAGDLGLADETLERARSRYPQEREVVRWSALIEGMQWEDEVALIELRRLARFDGIEAAEKSELQGMIGDLALRTGHYAESIPYLYAGRVGEQITRRNALAAIARALPYRRSEPRELAAELPLLAGPLPELICQVGERERPFVLDTGATLTTVSRSLARELGVTPLVPGGRGLDGAGHELDVSYGVLPPLALGTVRLDAQPILVVDDVRLALRDALGGPPRPPRAVIGLDVLARFRVTFDPSRRSVIFELPRGMPPTEAVDCVQHDGQCLVPVSIEGRRLWFVLDTGASHSSLTEAGLQRLAGGATRAVADFRHVRSPGGVQHTVRQVRDLAMRVSAVEFFGVDLPVVARRADGVFPVHGVLGADLVMRCRTTFDRGQLRVEAL